MAKGRGRARRQKNKATKRAGKQAKVDKRRTARQGRIATRKSAAVARADAKKVKNQAKFSPENVAARAEARGKTLGSVMDFGGQLVQQFAGGGDEAELDDVSPLLDEQMLPVAYSPDDDDEPSWMIPAAVGGGVLALLGLAFLAFK